MHYYTAATSENIPLCVPLMALIDYKGFRMTAQALLPLSDHSLVYGSKDAGKHVLMKHAPFNKCMEEVAKVLNLAPHMVGPSHELVRLHAAVDIEGHVGMDNRFYLLDLARSFPPEAPAVTSHLSDLFADGSTVRISVPNPKKAGEFIHTLGTVQKAYSHRRHYDILFADGSVVRKFPANRIHGLSLSIFWRLLRPEFVKHRGSHLVPLRELDVVSASTDQPQRRDSVAKSLRLDTGMRPLDILSPCDIVL